MKIYEKPMAIISKFEVEDVIAASSLNEERTSMYTEGVTGVSYDKTATQGVLFQW